MCGYQSSATLTTDRLRYKLQTRPLVREGAPRRRTKQLSGKRKETKNLVMGPKGVPDTRKERPTDSRSNQLNPTLRGNNSKNGRAVGRKRPESASELYRPSGRRLSAKLVPTTAYRGCHVVSAKDPYGRIVAFIDRSRYFFQVAPQLYSRG
jgi:hypothetical protein